MKFNGLLEFFQSHVDGNAASSEKKQNPPKDPEPAPLLDTTSSSPSSSATGESAAERRARLQAKMDEQERRDQIRREKHPQAQAKVAEGTEASKVKAEEAMPPAEPAVEVDEPFTQALNQGAAVGDTEASPVEQPDPEPAESVEEGVLEGQSPADIPVSANEPVPEEQPVAEGGHVEPERTIIHEEL
jgi:hypothetical protein